MTARRAPRPPAAEPEPELGPAPPVDLAGVVARLGAVVETLVARSIEHDDDICDLRARLPADTRLIAGLVPVKSIDCGYSTETIKRWARRGEIAAVRKGGRWFVD
jgi:hypothetical protein